jgi:hypothetical protein
VCTRSRIFFNYKSALSLLSKVCYLTIKHLFRKISYLLDINIEKIGINSFCNLFFSHLHSNVQYVLTRKKTEEAIWHINKDLPTPVPARAILSVLFGKPPFVILLKYSKIKRCLIFLSMIRLISFLIIK